MGKARQYFAAMNSLLNTRVETAVRTRQMSNSLLAMLLLSMLAVSLVMGSGNIPLQDTDRNQFTIGILRGDSVIVPFGEYHDGRWLTRWPKPEGFGEDFDNSLADLPDAWFDRNKALSTTWYYCASHDVATQIKASKIIKVQNLCQENWAVLCDFPGATLKAGEEHRNIGVALDVDKKIDNPIEIINRSQEWRRITSFIQPAFDKSEGIKPPGIDSLEPYVHHPSNAERRKARLSACFTEIENLLMDSVSTTSRQRRNTRIRSSPKQIRLVIRFLISRDG